MKLVLNAVMVMALLVAAGIAEEPVEVPPAVAEEDTLGLTQGKFLLQVVHEVGAEGFFEGTVPATVVADRFANLGLAPDGGWDVDGELTREVLAQAYNRLVATMTGPSDEGEGAAVGTASDDWTIAELVEKIMEAVEEALVNIQSVRLPVSPSRPTWR